ncbi:MAG: hypothetical protein ACFHX7_21955 [Pseudomonadota bacterium]
MTFDDEDFLPDSDPVRMLMAVAGLGTLDKFNYRRLLGWSLLWMFLLCAVTALEGRLFIGSVSAVVPGVGEVVGMSFAGDTMVWPFTLLIPVILVLCVTAIRRTRNLLNTLTKRVEQETGETGLPSDYVDSINKTKKIIVGDFGWVGRTLKFAPWLIALVFWIFNTTTCMLHPLAPVDIYPYKSNIVTVRQTDGSLVKQEFSQSVNVPKWDTSFEEAPITCLLTRLWTLIFYSLAPFLIIKLGLLVWAMTSFINSYSVWANNALYPNSNLMQPFHPDEFGGFRGVIEVGMVYFYVSIGFVSLVMLSFLKEGLDAPALHNYLLLILMIPLGLLGMLVPALATRRIVTSGKARYQREIAAHLDLMYDELRDALNGIDQNRLSEDFDIRLSALQSFFGQISSIKEWPFSASVLIRALVVGSAPFIGLVFDLLISRLMDG